LKSGQTRSHGEHCVQRLALRSGHAFERFDDFARIFYMANGCRWLCGSRLDGEEIA
jgi:hypothetical protein